MSRLLTTLGRSLAWALAPIAVAAVLVGVEFDRGPSKPSATAAAATPAKALEVSLLPDYSIPGGIESRTETVERTLFNPTRRPAPAPSETAQEAAKPRMQRGQFALTGTTVAPEGKSTAFLREVNGGKSRRVSEGDTINGLRVAEVRPDRVRLTMGDEQEDLHLKVVANPRPTPAAAPAGPAGPQGGAMPAPGAPVPIPAPTASGAAQPGVTAAQQSLIERRRAARAAAAAAATAAEQSRTDGTADQRTRPTAPQGSTGAPAWGDVFRAYQQRGAAGGVTQ